ncbi:histone H1 [Nannizzia gypsea CBS 118893]|uniref:Histone H1 n=1 Tax=Arthroderma gypseum (strain ATCC MYA-4604 / CBS 118893) TaxID=535722 RepID=E4UWX5_ARTGP|nr:histone H1 [Nannizzia gypsea CBS 118893]EFR02614.1 histone H1 [Nannizzia gypsea CBS 118893]
MPAKKAAGAASGKSSATHASYKDMIKDAIINLKERNGSSRQALKKYVQNNNTINITSQATFDAQFNRALKAAVEKGEFTQPKGPSGPVKLAKKEVTKSAAKPAAKKTATKAAAKPAAKKATTTTKKAAASKADKTDKADKADKADKPKKAAASTTKKAAATKSSKTKANTTKQRKATSSAPAVVDVPKVIGKTKSGRVTKTAAKPAAKKAAAKKKTTTTKGTPKKAAAAASS